MESNEKNTQNNDPEVALLFINISRWKQNTCHFTHVIFKYIFLNENYCVLIQISLFIF